jgi:Ca2+-binding RTX toxin-like protein
MASIVGTNGADTLSGTSGDDTLYGLDGDDVLLSSDGADAFDGGAGYDVVSYAAISSDLWVFMSYPPSIQPASPAAGDTFVSIEAVTLGSGNDYLQGPGSSGELTVHGGAGNDTIWSLMAAGGTAHLYGDAGDDTLIGSVATDIMDGGASDTLGNTVSYYTSSAGLTASLANQALNTGDAAGDHYLNLQHLIGTHYNDVMYGIDDGLENQLQGQDGDDVLYAADKTLDGTTVFIGGGGADAFYGAGGTARHYFIDYETVSDDPAFQGIGVKVDLLNAALNTGAAAGDSYNAITSADGVMMTGLAGSTNDDELWADNGDNGILGDPVVLGYGPGGADVIHGRDGDDNIAGNDGGFGTADGADTLYGDAGDDTLYGGLGADHLYGGTGADNFDYKDLGDSTAADMDVIHDFETGSDLIRFDRVVLTAVSIVRSGTDSYIFANATYTDPNTHVTTSGALQLASSGHDVNGADLRGLGGVGVYMLGDSAGNTLIGSGNNDTLAGEGGGDALYGGAGNDTIYGGASGDVLYGGTGADTFLYGAIGDSSVSAADTIFDFVSGQDKIDLHAVAAGSSHAHGFVVAGGSTFLFVDIGNDGVNDMLIQLSNVTNFQNSDIVW